MKLELKKIKIGISSRETTNYTAELYVNGQPCASAHNEGGGGMTMLTPGKNCSELLRAAESYAKTLPAVKSDDMMLDMTLDFWCDLQVGEFQLAKQILKHQKKGILAGIPGSGEYDHYQLKHQIADMMLMPSGRESLKKFLIGTVIKNLKPGEQILNTNLGNLLEEVGSSQEQLAVGEAPVSSKQ